MTGDSYWLNQGPITNAERKQAFTYLKKHDLPADQKHLRHRVARIRKRRDLNRFLKGKEEASADSATPWQVVYGSIQLGGTITFIHTSGPADQKDLYLHLVVTIAAHEINYLSTVFFDGYPVTWDTTLTTRPTGLVQATGLFAGYVKMQVNYGTDGQGALSVPVGDMSDALSPVGAKWTMNHRQRGHAHVYFRFKWQENLFKNGMPDITFNVSGLYNFADPRTSTTYPGGQNAAIALYNYLTNARWGLGMVAGDFNSTRLNQAITDCEDGIALAAGGSENRYLINTHFGTDQSPGTVVEDMLASMHGRLPYTEGKFSLWAGKARAGTVLTITADMILSDLQVVTKTPRYDTFNAVRGTFVSNQNSNEDSDFPAVRNATYVTQDNGEVVYEDFTFNMVTSATMVQRLAKIELEAIRQGIVVEFLARMDAYQAEPGEWVALTYARFGWTAKVFEVMRSMLVIEQDPSGSPFYAVRVTLQETAAGVYDWNSGNETTYDLAPNTNLPNPFTVTDPTGLTLASGTSYLYVRGDGTVFARLYVSWTAAADAFVVNGGYYEIQFKRSVDSNWQDAGDVPGSSTNYYILDVDDGNNYDVRIRSVSAMGARGNWVTATGHLVLGKTAAPSDPTGLSAVWQNDGVLISWTKISDLDINEYEVRMLPSAGVIGSSTVIGYTKSGSLFYVPPSGSFYRFFVRANDTSGNFSSNTVYTDLSTSAPTVSALSAAFVDGVIRVTWTGTAGSLPINEYEVRMTTTPGGLIGGTTVVGYARSGTFDYIPPAGGGTYRFYVRANDTSGNYSSNFVYYDLSLTGPALTSGISYSIVEGTAVLTWAGYSGSLPLNQYEVRMTTAPGGLIGVADVVGYVGSPRFSYELTTPGTYRFYVRANDTSANFSSNFVYVDVTVSTPDAVTGLTVSELSGNVFLAWSPPAQSTLPVARYEVYEGTEFLTAKLLDKPDGTFFTYLQRIPGVYTYWVRPINIRGAAGGLASIALAVRGPSSFVLAADRALAATAATLTYATNDGGAVNAILAPVDTSETWSQHFTFHSQTTIQGLITAGYSYWTDPGLTFPVQQPGRAQWELDLGGTFRSTTLTLSYLTAAIRTIGVVVPTICWREKTSDRWTAGPVGATQVVATNVRYVKVRADLNGFWLDPNAATLSNMAVSSGGSALFADMDSLLAPVYSAETWDAHFVSNGATTVSQLIAFGNAYWIDPIPVGVATAEWVVDFGRDIPSCNVAIRENDTTVRVGTGNVDMQLYYRLNATDAWAGSGSSFSSGLVPTAFRYLKVVLILNSLTGSTVGLLKSFFDCNVTLLGNTTSSEAVKVSQARLVVGHSKLPDSGTATVSAADAGGTFVPFNLPYIDAESPTATYSGTSDVKAVVIFDDVPSPLGFRVMLFDGTSTRQSGTVGWNASGIVS